MMLDARCAKSAKTKNPEIQHIAANRLLGEPAMLQHRHVYRYWRHITCQPMGEMTMRRCDVGSIRQIVMSDEALVAVREGEAAALKPVNWWRAVTTSVDTFERST
ncbi:hypothetical protein ACVIWU_004671 [Bradyrhizobium sp. USDA 4509]|nr:hypothetical protein [Bradyrhizobium sp. USDA 4541]